MKKTKQTQQPDVYPIPKSLNDPAFHQAWKEWVAYRKDKGKPISRHAATKQLNKLAKFPVDVAIRAIDLSIENDWQGLFPGNIQQDQSHQLREINQLTQLATSQFPTEAEAWSIVKHTIDKRRYANTAEEVAAIKADVPEIVLAVAESMGFRNIEDGNAKEVRTEFCHLYRKQVEAVVRRHLANRLPCHEAITVDTSESVRIATKSTKRD